MLKHSSGEPDPICTTCGCLAELSPKNYPPMGAPYKPLRFNDRASVEAYLSTFAMEPIEWLIALYIDSKINLLSVHVVGKGSSGGCEISLGRIYMLGKSLHAAGFILVHNHPSGDPTPSSSDVRATKWLSRMSAELDMPLLDHFVVAKNGVRLVNVGT